MEHSVAALFVLLAVFVASLIGGEVAQRLKLPSVVGEIFAGCIIGPHMLNLIKIDISLELFAELGAIFLLFSVGLETRLADLTRVGKVASYVGVAGVILPFIFGGLWAYFSGYESANALFIGAAFVATSAGITARVLQELGVVNRIESRIVLGAAVIDDILAMLLLSLVTSIQSTGSVELTKVLVVLVRAIIFIGIFAVFGTKLMKRSSQLLELPINSHAPLMLSIMACLALAVAATHIGLAAIIGAFLAGICVAETRQRHTLENQMQPILAFFVPFFFVVTGAKVDLTQLTNIDVAMTVCVVTVLAVLSKILACALGAVSLGTYSALIVGVGMVPRGEVGVIVANLGLQAGVFSHTLYSVIVLMSLLTSVVAPPALKVLFSRTPQSGD